MLNVSKKRSKKFRFSPKMSNNVILHNNVKYVFIKKLTFLKKTEKIGLRFTYFLGHAMSIDPIFYCFLVKLLILITLYL